MMGLQAALVTYDYSYDRVNGFQVVLNGEHLLPPTMYYPTSWSTDPVTGRTAMADCVTGGIWVSDAYYENWTLNLVPDGFGLHPWPANVTIDVDGDPNTPEVPGMWATFPDLVNGGVQEEPFVVPLTQMGLVTPGLHDVHYVAPLRKFVYVSPTPGTNIDMVDADVLFDGSVPPNMKETETLVESQLGVTDWNGTVWHNEFNPNSEWVYFLHSQSNTSWPGQSAFGELAPSWYRVNIYTYEVELLFSDPALDVPSHHYPVPCPLGLGSMFTCGYAISTYQQTMPDANGFVTNYDRLPTSSKFTMMMFFEPPSHHGHHWSN
jgi:hypothetical protein